MRKIKVKRKGKRMNTGKPRRFESGEELEESMVEYIRWCESVGHLPNIAGFCVHCNMTQETFYQQKNYYPESYQKVQALLETAVINNPKASDTMKIFYMKNKFKYTDKVQNEILTPEPIKIQHFEKLTDEQLELLRELTAVIDND